MVASSPHRETLLQIAQQLPASPQVLLQLNEVLTDMNSGLDDVARLLRRDTALAARIIRISNSVVFGMGSRVATVEEAVNRVGYAEIYRLTGLAAAAQLADQNLSFYGITGVQLRDNTLVTALAAEVLAQRIGVDSRIAYTTGLLRSTAKLVLDRYAKKVSPPVTPLPQSGLDRISAWERNHFGTTNPDVAAEVLGAWRFPAAIVDPVRLQYSDTGLPPASAPTCRLLRIASSLATQAGFGLPHESADLQPSDGAWGELGLSPSFVAECVDEAKNNFDLLKSSL